MMSRLEKPEEDGSNGRWSLNRLDEPEPLRAAQRASCGPLRLRGSSGAVRGGWAFGAVVRLVGGVMVVVIDAASFLEAQCED
jgi:hypothetical protein